MRAAHTNAGSLAIVLLLLHGADVLAAEPLQGNVGAAPATGYRVPTDAGPPRRVGGVPRGSAAVEPTIAALVPDHLGRTAAEQPRLYWFLSAPTDARIEITLVEPGREAPLLELAVSGRAAGLHAVDLARQDVRLRAGVEYEWSVALVADLGQRSRDMVSGGAIVRMAMDAGISARLAAVPADGRAEAFAREGLWYDALAAAADLAERSGDAKDARAMQSALLEQVGLAQAARFVRGR